MEEERKENGNNGQDRDRVHVLLFLMYGVFALLAMVVIARILYIQLIYKPESVYVERFTTGDRKVVIEPERGAILSYDGKTLAASTPKYQIAMDCTVRKEEFAKLKDREDREKKEAEWMGKARELAKGLSGIYGDKTASEYYSMIAGCRREGARYVRSRGPI